MSRQRKSIKFFVATDVHLGHKQNHPVRKNDSFNAFQQVLDISTKENADFLLLGGDLFDEVNPSQKTIYKCLDILQHYVQGQSSKNLNAHWQDHPQYRINFSNHNMSIKLPIFTIHGNHDYPSNDFGKISICDLLHVSNYANYFGKHTNLTEIVIKPMIIQKQGMKMKIAVYGLGYIKDNVLNQLFDKGKVKFQKVQNRQQYFCLFVFHQNRYKKGLRAGAPALKCISSKHIPQWMDLTIWGHEHQAISKIDIEDDRRIFQPGSTVITSFIQAQSFLKQCLKIQIFDDGQIDISPTPLVKSYRPMICRNYEIQQLFYNYNKNNNEKQFDFYSYLDNQLSTIIDHVDKQFPKKKPIIRMKIQYTGFEIGRCKMLQLKYTQKVANADSILTFWKRKQQKAQNDKQVIQALKDKTDLNLEQKQITQEILMKYIQSQQNKNLYFDPRQLYSRHINSIQRDGHVQKEYLNHYFTKQVEKKSRGVVKEIEDLYKMGVRETDVIVKGKIGEVLKWLELGEDDSSGSDDNDGLNNHKNDNKNSQHPIIPQRSIRQLWQQQKRQLLMKEDQINSTNLLKNYGQNFIDRQSIKNMKKPNINNNSNKKDQHQVMQNKQSSIRMKHQQRQSSTLRRSTASIPEQWRVIESQKRMAKHTNSSNGNNNNNKNKNSNKMQVQYQYQQPSYQKNNKKRRQERQQNLNKLNSRQGILKKSSNNNKKKQNNNKKDRIKSQQSDSHYWSQSQYQQQQQKEQHQHHHHNHNSQQQEEDCCKRAQKTPYNQGQTRNNFNGAHDMVKKGNDKNKKIMKKNIKQKSIQQSMQMKIIEKKNNNLNNNSNNNNKKKSVKWSDSDLE